MSFTTETAMDYLGFPEETKSYILEVYNEGHRKYHNESHLDNMLRWVTPDYPKLTPLLESILFHDFIYCDHIVPTGFNEAASIAVYSAVKTANEVDLSVMLVPIEAINATAHHLKDQTQPVLTDISQLVLDLDLQSFSRPRDEFLVDSNAVIDEMVGFGIDRKKVIAGNKKFLQQLLKRRNLYYLLQDWEEPARQNLEWRIKNMGVR